MHPNLDMSKGYEWEGPDPNAGYHRSYEFIEIEEKLAGSEYENIFMMRGLTHGSIDSSHNLIPHRRFYKWCKNFYMKEFIGRI